MKKRFEELTEYEQQKGVVAAMRYYGGRFVKSLADVLACADSESSEKLRGVFPEMWEAYWQMARYAYEKEVIND